MESNHSQTQFLPPEAYCAPNRHNLKLWQCILLPVFQGMPFCRATVRLGGTPMRVPVPHERTDRMDWKVLLQSSSPSGRTSETDLLPNSQWQTIRMCTRSSITRTFAKIIEAIGIGTFVAWNAHFPRQEFVGIWKVSTLLASILPSVCPDVCSSLAQEHNHCHPGCLFAKENFFQTEFFCRVFRCSWGRRSDRSKRLLPDLEESFPILAVVVCRSKVKSNLLDLHFW